MNKKEYKALKKEIVRETAINVGYWNEVLNHLPFYAVQEAYENAQDYIFSVTNEAEKNNIIVTEAVKAMNYQDFKKIAKYFFGGC